MKKNILLQIFLVLSFVLLSNKVYAVQDSIWPRTAKGAWDPARQQLYPLRIGLQFSDMEI